MEVARVCDVRYKDNLPPVNTSQDPLVLLHTKRLGVHVAWLDILEGFICTCLGLDWFLVGHRKGRTELEYNVE